MSFSFFKYQSPSSLPLLCSLLTCTFVLSPSAHSAERFFTPPEAPFITSPKEQIHRIDLPAGTAEAAQTLIDRARKEMPDTFLLIQTSGNLEVGPTPLRLSSNMALHLSSSAGIVASPSCSAPCLILIEKSELVSISSSGSGAATLDGAGKSVSGIQIGAGVKAGSVYGASDDYGINVASDPVHMHDFHATILHLLGLNHEKLTFFHTGRDYRLTDVSGNVVGGLLA